MIEDHNRKSRVTRPMRRLTTSQIGLILAGILILVFVAWTAASTRRQNPDKLTDATSAAATDSSQKRCGSQSTYDLIKRELFRRAAVLRGSDQAAFDKLAAYAVVRVDRPLFDSTDDETGAINCSGALTLDLPPGVQVVGGRRSLNADIGYALQGSADGNGQVLTLTRADAIVAPLATLSRGAGNTAAEPTVTPRAPTDSPVPGSGPAPEPAVVANSPPLPAPPAPRSMAPAPAPERERVTASASRPSFSCANARTRGEIAVCGDDGLASLDRQMSSQFYSAMRSADPEMRAMLQRTRTRFLTYRDQCPSNACIDQTYRGRIREIRDIANGRLR